MRLFDQAKYSFIEKRGGAYVFSAVLILVGIGAMVFNVFSIGSWQDYGVDFTGGSMIQIEFHQPAEAGDLRDALEDAQVTSFGEENEFTIRVPLGDEDVETIRLGVQADLEATFGTDAFTIVRTETVGPKIGEELQTKAALAILYSFVLTLMYIWVRFEFRFGLAAVIATLHDILITLGFLALFRVEFALPTVAAILTIVGYSLNDTIVVFDRIRENLNAKGGRREDPKLLVNRSINETLPRTVLTSGTTLAVLFALLVVGGAVIRDFTLVLILGVTVGTYSSIFVASPALLEIQKRFGDGTASRERRKKREARATT
ncbi:MAG: protein translocase subunit SecF [Gemmatimonadetes bacterium]|nr:protein translocase subunit SecF [Gemmatimonadota bacterium]